MAVLFWLIAPHLRLFYLGETPMSSVQGPLFSHSVGGMAEEPARWLGVLVVSNFKGHQWNKRPQDEARDKVPFQSSVWRKEKTRLEDESN